MILMKQEVTGNWKKEGLYWILWRIRFWKDSGPVVRQTAEWWREECKRHSNSDVQEVSVRSNAQKKKL